MYERLHKLNLCVSHSETIKTLDQLGESFDLPVMEWKAQLLFHNREVIIPIILTNNLSTE